MNSNDHIVSALTSEPTSELTSGLIRQGNQYILQGFPVLGLPDEERATKYFSLNPFLPNLDNRCPIGCAYCVCHQDSDWHHHPEKFGEAIAPSNLLDQLLDLIVATPEGRQGWPISLCDYSDPFIQPHQDRVLTILTALMERNMRNMVYITTKVHPGKIFLQKLKILLARPNQLRVTVFASLAPLKPGYETASVQGRVQLLQDLVAMRIPCCWYLRPLVEAWFDEATMWTLARQIVPYVTHHVILSGIVMSDEIAANLLAQDLVVPEWNQTQAGHKQPLSFEFEAQLRSILRSVAAEYGLDLGPVMGHRLCGTNGNYAYSCLQCGKKDRYCQLFQLHHYGKTIEIANH